MTNEQELLSSLDSILWQPSAEEKALAEALPTEFRIDVPHFVSERMHWSGPAYAQMHFKFYGRRVPSQAEIAADLGIVDWQFMNHESLEEDLLRFMAKRNFVPAIYFPAMKLRPHFEKAEEMGDFMYRNIEAISARDWNFVKALLVTQNAPVFLRIHFTTDDYPMPEEMAQRLDSVGHGVVAVGYNKFGFIINDSWDCERWGGSRGGKDMLLTYDELIGPNMLVNSTLDYMATFAPLRAMFRAPHQIPFPEKEIDLEVTVSTSGLRSIQGDHYALARLQGILRVHPNFSVVEPVCRTDGTLSPGETGTLRWRLNTGRLIGSFPVSAIVQASLNLPCRPWERNNRSDETVTICAEAKIRIDVKDPHWFAFYGKLE